MTRFSNHFASGVHTEIEYPDRVAFHRRWGWGLEVQQAADPPGRNNNWFHIGVPIVMSDRLSAGVGIRKLFYSLELNENARLAEIHIRKGPHLGFNIDRSHVGRSVEETIDLYTAAVAIPPTICFRVEFLTGTPIGKVVFFSAGVEVEAIDDR